MLLGGRLLSIRSLEILRLLFLGTLELVLLLLIAIILLLIPISLFLILIVTVIVKMLLRRIVEHLILLFLFFDLFLLGS